MPLVKFCDGEVAISLREVLCGLEGFVEACDPGTVSYYEVNKLWRMSLDLGNKISVYRASQNLPSVPDTEPSTARETRQM